MSDELLPHPAADAFPMMDRARYSELVEDIRNHGQREEILLCEGKILDGRNRYRACREIGIEPKIRNVEGNPWDFAWSMNGQRRDLVAEQRYLIWKFCSEASESWQATENRIKQEANRKREAAAKGNKNAAKGDAKTVVQQSVALLNSQPPKPEPGPRPKKDPHIKQAAKATASKTNPGAVARGDRLVKADRELAAKVRMGEVKPAVAHRIIKEREKKELAAKVDAAEPKKPKKQVARGEWWSLGRHTLYCGDTSSAEFQSRLPKCELAFADPPYGAGKSGYDDSKFYWEHDYLINFAEIVVVTPGIVSIFEFARKTSMPYKWSVSCWLSNGMTRGAIGFGNWIYGAVFSRGSVFRQKQDFCQVVVRNSETGDTEHTTRKPSDYMTWLVTTFMKQKGTVIDPFLGSGQTLMACEATGHRCIGGEIDPKFCEAIISRWETMTGMEASKDGVDTVL
jgi:predicted RNA methylase